MNGDAEQQGKPPKSADSIRAALEAVRQSTCPAPQAGPHQAGLASDAPLVIASFYDPEVARGFVDLLVAAGILSATLRRGFRQDQVLVDSGDRRKAAELLAAYLVGKPYRMVTRFRRSIDFMLLGAAMGGVSGAIGIASRSVTSSTLLNFRAAVAVVGFTIYGGIIGFLLGQFDDRSRRTGRLQFSIREMLLIVTLFALIFMSWNALAGVWR